MASKKSSVKTSSKKNKLTRWQKFRIFLLVLIVFVGVVAIFAGLKGLIPRVLGGASLSGQLAAQVNGEEITVSELDESYERLPQEYRAFMTKEEFLGQMIDNVLLRQKAVESGIVVTDFEAEQNVKEFMQQSQISDEELRVLLENKSLDYDELVRISRDQLLVQRLIAMEVTSQVEPTTEDALNYYNQNVEQFVTPEILTVRHILFATEAANRTVAQADAEAERVLGLLEPGHSNFCQLVEEYTDDRASVPVCGQYQFQKDQLPEDFDAWSASAQIGGVDIVSTPYGTHIMLLVNKTPASYVSFRDVQDQILASLERGDEQEAYRSYIANLRETADVKIYYGETPQQALPEQETADEGTSPEEDAIAPAEEANATPAIPEAPAEPEEPSAPEEPQSANLYIQCLAEKKAALYGAKWDSLTSEQKTLFGTSEMDRLSYIECSVEGDYKSQSDECRRAGIEAYPTWIIGAAKHMGVYTPKELAEAAGC